MNAVPVTGLRVGVIGLGRFGRAHLRNWLSAGVRPVAVADPDLANLDGAARLVPDALLLLDPNDLLDSVDLDAVSIASPGSTHVALAIAAMERGVRVLLEKPVAESMAECRLLLAAGAEELVTPGHVLRYSAPHRSVRTAVAQGRIGRLVSISASRLRDRTHLAYGEPDPIFLTQVHDLDLALWICGQAPRELATSFEMDGDVAVRAVTRATLGSGIAWDLTSSWQLPAGEPGRDRLSVLGEQGRLTLDVDHEGSRLSLHGGHPVAGSQEWSWAPEPEPGLADELAEFGADVAAGVRGSTIRFGDALHVIALAEAARRSGRSAGRVEEVERP